MTTDLPEIRIITFSGESCPVCVGMEKAGTVAKFIAKHPEVKAKTLMINDKNGESPKGTEYEKNYELSDAYGVEVVPTLVFEVKEGGELLRFEGGASLKQLEESYEEAIVGLKASREISW